MSSDAAKKRKVNDNISSDTVAAAGVEDIIAEMKVHMTRMQNEIDSKTAAMQSEIDSTKTENIFLKAKCESLQRSMQILIDEQKWEYSAPDIPTSYWDERGFDQDYIEDMKNFLTQIKEATCKLRTGKDVKAEWITVGNDDSDTALLHEDVLIPHWKELANAMELYQKEELLEISIYNLQLTASVIDLLKPVLKHNPIKYIDLQNNGFANDREGIEFAVEVMKSNKMMKSFHWTSNAIHSMEDARHLVDSIISHPSIDCIGLENCFEGDVNGYHILHSLLTSDKNFSSISLERNHIRTRGDTAIPDYIATNPPLKELFLANNNLNDEDARLIAHALKRNTNLQYLLQFDNDFTEVGHIALCNAICDSTSLNSMSDCNHTCYINGINSTDISNNCHGFSPNSHRARKIYHLLSLRNKEGSNVYHLNLEFGDEDEGDGDGDSTLKLVPRVLESVHRYASVRSVVPSLSIMYEILRGWKMPELYEAR